MFKKFIRTAFCLSFALFLIVFLYACAEDGEFDIVEIEAPQSPLADIPVPEILIPLATESSVYKNKDAVIDYSNISDGYIMIKYEGSSEKRLKVQIKHPDDVTYTYNLSNKGDYEVYTLSGGNGKYLISVLQNTSGTKYARLASYEIEVDFINEFLPFLYPNQYVNYNEESKAVLLAEELTKKTESDLDKISVIYKYVTENIEYDYDRAENVKSGYVPDIDQILVDKKGICFDYSSLMTAMLRSLSIPTKLIFGYSGEVYHAWLNTYVEDIGWIESVIYFDGKDWKLMDPTFASSAKKKNSKYILEYIGDASNYSAVYQY